MDIDKLIKRYGLIPYKKTITIDLDEYNTLINQKKDITRLELSAIEKTYENYIDNEILKRTIDNLGDYISDLKKDNHILREKLNIIKQL